MDQPVVAEVFCDELARRDRALNVSAHRGITICAQWGYGSGVATPVPARSGRPGRRLRVLDTQTNQFVGSPTTHASLLTPHGLFPNPSGTLAMSTQYAFELDEVSIWNLDGTTGVISFDKTVTLADGPVFGAYTHNAVWLDDTRFYTNCTQELTQGSGTFQRSVWLVDAVAGTATAVLDNTDLLEGVSDQVIANGKLYVAEPVEAIPRRRPRAGARGGPPPKLSAHGLPVDPDGPHHFAAARVLFVPQDDLVTRRQARPSGGDLPDLGDEPRAHHPQPRPLLYGTSPGRRKRPSASVPTRTPRPSGTWFQPAGVPGGGSAVSAARSATVLTAASATGRPSTSITRPSTGEDARSGSSIHAGLPLSPASSRPCSWQ